MSRNSLILEKAASQNTSWAAMEAPTRSGEYLDLIRQLFQSHSVVAVVKAPWFRIPWFRGFEGNRGRAGRWGNRVVIVQVEALLRTNPLPDATACPPGRVPNVSRGPPPAALPLSSSGPPRPRLRPATGSVRCGETSIRWYWIAPRSKRRPPLPRSRPRRMRQSWWWKLSVPPDNRSSVTSRRSS